LTEPAANPEIATKAKTLPTASVTGPRSEANPGGEGLPLYAYGVEFVTLPGESDKLRTEIPFLVRAANEKSRGFSGCLVLVSEQEARLVTVITLWMTRDGEKECHEKRLKRQLEPYVDRWLRTRRFVTFLSMSFGKDFWQREA
jgi:hypothetical protein